MFDLIERGHSSAVTLLELLVQPCRDQKEELAQKIFALAGTCPQIEWVPVTLNLADRAAELRARYRLSAPDVIQLATAISRETTCFYGNGRALRRIKEIECVLVDESDMTTSQ